MYENVLWCVVKHTAYGEHLCLGLFCVHYDIPALSNSVVYAFTYRYIIPARRVTYLSSISGIGGIAGQTNYSCSKAGVIGYVEQLGADMAERGIGINAIAPGTIATTAFDCDFNSNSNYISVITVMDCIIDYCIVCFMNMMMRPLHVGFIETEMTGKVPFMMRNVGRVVSALVQSGYPTDIAETALFLSSPASVGLNGQTIRVCGGHIVGA
jgi:3-oxoacyl-[acyl-carrier protein] reductase